MMGSVEPRACYPKSKHEGREVRTCCREQEEILNGISLPGGVQVKTHRGGGTDIHSGKEAHLNAGSGQTGQTDVDIPSWLEFSSAASLQWKRGDKGEH